MYLMNSRLRIRVPKDDAAGAAGATSGAASVRPSCVSGWREIVIAAVLARKAWPCRCRRPAGLGRRLDWPLAARRRAAVTLEPDDRARRSKENGKFSDGRRF